MAEQQAPEAGRERAGGGRITVEVAFGLPSEQVILPVELPAGATVRDAIEQSGILERFPEIDLAVNKVGIWDKVTTLDHEVADGDRVEIYRPLLADPKEVRRLRAAQGKKLRKGGAGG